MASDQAQSMVRRGWLRNGLAALLFLAGLGGYLWHSSGGSAGDAEEVQRYEVARGALADIRRASSDPDSLVWGRVATNSDAGVVCVELRGRNAFGGYVRGVVTWFEGAVDSSSEFFRVACLGDGLYELDLQRLR